MKHIALLLGLITASPLQAACFADYKAKQDDPLRLHYGVAQIASQTCTIEVASQDLAPRLAAQGWTLLNVVSVFDDAQLDDKKENAGEHFLRY
ncbi:hypothetical protein [Nereida sp. MMG025]|uniref:hypothetical protein n=1 Tax=Nereida sp. MMG025 TaxID=2909981 RepID=UPI001F2D2BC4|nr:hypothetical protein [Nereida sp. MMG025]MCF6444755.1 hypothetical protein [Nereida sp. MMG025]